MSRAFKRDMEISASFCELYSKLGDSNSSCITQNKGEETLENLLKELKTLDSPTLSRVDSLYESFINQKHKTFQGYTISDDIITTEILEYGHLEVIPISIYKP